MWIYRINSRSLHDCLNFLGERHASGPQHRSLGFTVMICKVVGRWLGAEFHAHVVYHLPSGGTAVDWNSTIVISMG